MASKGLTIAAALIAASTLALGAGSAQAESACKGLEKAACDSKSTCAWVGGYTRKDKSKVSGYCRSKPSSKKKTSQSSKKKTS
jgi:hypothetical protein